MKARELNNSSKKTKRLIKKVFAEMLSEQKELGNISVSELCRRADISRGSFYSHYDDIYGVAEEYENEMIDTFFDTARMLESTNIMQFIDSLFEFIRENDESYRQLCSSNEFLFAAKKLTSIAAPKLVELAHCDLRIVDTTHLELEIQIFLEGILCEYVKYCRGYSTVTLDSLYTYTKYWVEGFIRRHSLDYMRNYLPAPLIPDENMI